MAAKAMKDYLSAMTADYTTTTLSVNPQHTLDEQAADENTIIYTGVDGSQQPVVVGGAAAFFLVTVRWEWLTAADAGTVIDFYYDPAKANRTAKTFYWLHPEDHNTYVVRFASPVPRTITKDGWHKIPTVTLRVNGYKAA